MNENDLTCEQALRLLATYLDHELDDRETEHVHKHLERCKSCYSRAEFERRLKLQLVTLRSTTVSNALEQRVRAIVHGFETP